MLTRQQHQLLEFMRSYAADNRGIIPSFEEMMHGMGLRSKSGIHRLIGGLEERGFIKRLHRRARAIRFTDKTLDNNVVRCVHCGELTPVEMELDQKDMH